MDLDYEKRKQERMSRPRNKILLNYYKRKLIIINKIDRFLNNINDDCAVVIKNILAILFNIIWICFVIICIIISVAAIFMIGSKLIENVFVL